eukprot:CAMPEP_0117418510 /NCGR_PEP_ID=MMETSP0758-20121206/266_1 /TAXON_ID=63605 /ORGANISM="Percolomonas cosmopolitus, Strain AE-1 (ATCC 50343)" /LENGTH=648 /DNA_ID=CAMNT_0005199035 /DNA_START=445 /DNA_END=2392 /DNA_ORIENTATION=-
MLYDKEVTVNRLVIDQFSDKVEQCCLNPDKTKEALRKLKKDVNVRLAQCDEKTEEADAETKRFTGALTSCFADVFNADKQDTCFDDTECDTKCNRISHRCVPPALSDNKAAIVFGKCLATELGTAELAGFKKTIAGDSSADADTFGAKIAQEISADICVSKTISWDRKASLAQVACTSATACSNGQATCGDTNGFCGFSCIEENSKKRCVGSLPLTETQCNSLGYCSTGDKNIAEAACKQKQFCTHPAYPTATGSACTDKYICMGYPVAFGGNKCVKNATVSARGEVNVCGSFGFFDNRLQACISADVTMDATKCTNAGGRWEGAPTTKEKCESYGFCVARNGVRKFKSKKDCESCEGDRWVTPFKAVQARVINGTFIRHFEWVSAKEMYNPYKWVSAIDSTKAAVFAYKAMAKFVVPRIAASFKCKLEPYINALQQVACDCGTKPQEKCYQPKETVVESKQLFKGVKSELMDSASGSALIIGESSVGTAQDGNTFSLTASVHVSASASASSRSTKETSIVVKNKAGKAVGGVIGAGMKVEPAPAGGAELCLEVDSSLNVDSAYTKFGFAIANTEGEGYLYVDMPVTNTDTNVKVCSKVSDSKTYYPAKYSPDASNEDDKKDDSAAATSTFSMTLCVIVILFTFGLMA